MKDAAEARRAGEVHVVVALSDDGHAVIDHLMVDGRPWRSGDCHRFLKHGVDRDGRTPAESGHPAGE